MRTALVLLVSWASVGLSAEPDGAAIYKRDCARCHGPAGQGTKEHPKALVGDRSVGQLTRYIQKTMPEDNPGTLSDADSAKVAAFISDAFYSKIARERSRPARVELSRLTVGQYRNTLADLIGSFRGPSRWDPAQPGLKAEYFKNRRFRNTDRVIERVDPTVSFDFGEGSPAGDKIEAHEFSIRWEGSVLAPETGEYDFIVKTEHAARLWLNDPAKPLIDAWVKSGNDTEYKASLSLVGGRVYPLRLEFSKAKQGVDDSKTNKQKPKPVKASIALEWKRPGLPTEVIPARNLSTVRTPAVMVVATPFPPDDKSIGYERGSSVSKAWDQSTTEAAIEVASYVDARLNDLAGTTNVAKDRPEKLKTFVARFVERAFRRPLSDEDRKFYVDHHFAAAKSPEAAVRRAVLFTLKSPRFLYRESAAGNDPFDVASRLSYTLWDAPPDQELWKAASEGKLGKRDEITAQARRMLGDIRARAKVRGFLLDWLRVDPVPDLTKDPKTLGAFDPKIALDLRTSLELYLDDVVWGETSDFRRFFEDDALYLNGRLAKFYGAKLPADAGFQKVKLDEKERAGLLTHPYLMATFAYTATSSPIHRGVFISRSILGRSLKPPPEAVAPIPADLHPNLTTRERIELQTKPATCLGCHVMINPLGFGLEHFDVVGRYRKEEKGKPINAKGTHESLSGESIPFDGARSLAKVLIQSEETKSAFVEQLFQTMVKQPIRAYGKNAIGDLRSKFEADGLNMKKLMIEIAALSAQPAQPSAAPTATASVRTQP